MVIYHGKICKKHTKNIQVAPLKTKIRLAGKSRKTLAGREFGVGTAFSVSPPSVSEVSTHCGGTQLACHKPTGVGTRSAHGCPDVIETEMAGWEIPHVSLGNPPFFMGKYIFTHSLVDFPARH